MGARKPLALHTGHHTKADIERLNAEDAVATGTRKCFSDTPPDELIDTIAKDEWLRITDILNDMEIIGDLDKSSLIGYCNAFSLYRRATAELATTSLIVETQRGPAKNPLISVQDTYAKQMRDFAMKCGLSIDYRLKCATLKVKSDNDEISGVFGDI